MPDIVKELLKRDIEFTYKFNQKRNKVVYKIHNIFYEKNWIEIFEFRETECVIKTKSGNKFVISDIDELVRYNYELYINNISKSIELFPGFKNDFERLKLRIEYD